MPGIKGTYRDGWGKGTLGTNGWLVLGPAVFGVESVETWVAIEHFVVSVQINPEAVPQNED